MPTTSKTHSKYYTTMFPQHLMEEHFQGGTPTAIQRANKFKDFWEQWAHNEIVLPKNRNHASVHKLLDQHMKSLFEYQIRSALREDHDREKGKITAWGPDSQGKNHQKFVSKVLVIRFASPELMALAKIILS